MKFDEIARLLDPSPMPLETGYERSAEGVLHVACRTDLHNCTGAMFQWWFGSRPHTREYKWWHPIDHISSEWVGGARGDVVGATHVVEERLTAVPARKLSIQFRDPAEFFRPEALAQARASGAVTGMVCGRVGDGHTPHMTKDGAILGSRLIHICRDTEWGTALRSHFFLGVDLPAVGMAPGEINALFDEQFAPSLLQHCYDEFTFLSRILPSLYIAEQGDTTKLKRPW